MYRVIIVEDDPRISKISKEYVEKSGKFQVKAVFSNGQEALNYIWLHPVDLIVLDLYMPSMNGKEFLYRLRKENIPVEVVVVTAANDAANMREVLPFGVLDYLLKPFSYDRFSQALERFIQRHQIIHALSGLDQGGIDAAFAFPAEQEVSQKIDLQARGLVPAHYQALREYLKTHADSAFSAAELADAAGVSKVSIRRYLNCMIEYREATSCVQTKNAAQPTVSYRWNPPQEEST